MKHRGRWIALGGILAILAAAIVAVCVVDPKYDLHYTVSAPEVKANTLEVVLEVHNSPLSRGKTVSLYIGDKDVTVQSCTGADGVSLPAHQTEDFLTFELGRGADVSLVYQVPLGASGKHGQRGMVQEEYCVFDGGQALLLPMEFYQDGFPQDEAVVRSLRVALKAREGWTVILPFEELQDVTWADAYNLNNDAFAMGNFTQYFPAEQTGGAAVYGVAGEEGQFPQEVASGISALRAYYAAKKSSRIRSSSCQQRKGT